MRIKGILCLLAVIVFSLPIFAQVSTKTGSIYGKVIDENSAPLPGVTITLESDVLTTQVATSGSSGGFRFANLPPGIYAVNFFMQGFTEVRQEEVQVSTGSQVQLETKLNPNLDMKMVIVDTPPLIDTAEIGNSNIYDSDYMQDVPNPRDPWFIIDQTTGIDVDRINVAGSESGQQAAFVARGGNDDNTIWNYNGVNATDPGAVGASPTYFDFESFQELQISTGGNDASIPTGGVAVNIVSKRAGNKWEANASFFYSGDSLQGDNTPDELAAIGAQSNRLDEVKDYGFDLGGPIVKDKLFVWGAFRKNDIGLITTANTFDLTHLESSTWTHPVIWNKHVLIKDISNLTLWTF